MLENKEEKTEIELKSTFYDALDFQFNLYLDQQKEKGLVTKQVFFLMTAEDQKNFFKQWKKMHVATSIMYSLIYKYRKMRRD